MTSTSRAFRRVLVASGDRSLRADVAAVIRSLGLTAIESRGVREAILMLNSRPDVLMFGTDLIDPRSYELVEAANNTRPIPLRIAIGSNVPGDEAFELGRRGISRLLPNPPAARDIAAAVREVRAYDVTPILADVVGLVGLAEVQAGVREAMTTQALALARGNRGAAARLLGLSRQALHQSLRRHSDPVVSVDWPRQAPPS